MDKNKVLDFVLRVVATAATVQTSGLTDELKADLDALIQEAQDSILEPQDDGTPWTPEALRAWYLQTLQTNAEIRNRHTAS
jgi:hypothetical protein